MNVFNRFLVIVLLLAVAAIAVTVIVFAWAAPNEGIDGLQNAVDWLRDNQTDLEKTLISSGAGLIALFLDRISVDEPARSFVASPKLKPGT